MTKLLTALLAATFAMVTLVPVAFAQEKKASPVAAAFSSFVCAKATGETDAAAKTAASTIASSLLMMFPSSWLVEKFCKRPIIGQRF